MSETWLSQGAYDRLREELTELQTAGRARLSKEIEIARAHGDIRENAEYHAAKEEQGKMESRIRQLEQLLRDAHIGEPPAGDVVAPGLVVTIEIDGDEETFLVGSREDRHDEHDVLSASSPIGQAILGAKVGQKVKVDAPRGAFEVVVKSLIAG